MRLFFSHALLILLALPSESYGLWIAAIPGSEDAVQAELDLEIHMRPSPDEADQIQLDPDAHVLGNESHVPFSGTGPSNADAFVEEVRRVFLAPLPQNPRDLAQFVQDLNARVVWTNRRAFVGRTDLIDIRAPWIRSCRPVINGVKPLSTPIFCSNVPCSPRVSFRVEERYETQETTRIETTISASAGYGGFEASVSRTNERIWSRIWSTSTSQDSTYQWHLGPNDHCTPSMAHVELDCEVDFMTTYYDSFVHDNNRLRLEHDYNRKTGPYFAQQWCTQFEVQAQPVDRNEHWEVLLSNNQGRGSIWKLPARDMRQYFRNGNSIHNNMLIMRRPRGSPGQLTELIGCRPAPATRTTRRMTLPLSSANGVLHGFVGCVSSGRKVSSAPEEESEAELKAKN